MAGRNLNGVTRNARGADDSAQHGLCKTLGVSSFRLVNHGNVRHRIIDLLFRRSQDRQSAILPSCKFLIRLCKIANCDFFPAWIIPKTGMSSSATWRPTPDNARAFGGLSILYGDSRGGFLSRTHTRRCAGERPFCWRFPTLPGTPGCGPVSFSDAAYRTLAAGDRSGCVSACSGRTLCFRYQKPDPTS